jgi:hypothetical protein
MISEFKYIITKVIFTENAYLGSFIINGDWMISQHGTVNGSESTNYTAFDPEHPNDNTGSNFIPNFAIDGLTGKTYQNDAYVRGEIHATSGDFMAGTTGYKVEVFSDEKLGRYYQSGFRGLSPEGDELFKLGFHQYATKLIAALKFGLTQFRDYGMSIQDTAAFLDVKMEGNKVVIMAPYTAWPTKDELESLVKGQVYIDSNGFLKVKNTD